MRAESRPRPSLLRVLLLAGLLVASARAAAPAEVTAFISGASPGEAWGRGYGGVLTITLFNIVGGEIEGAWQGAELPSTSLFTLSAKAYIGPQIGRFVPYGGLGAGVPRIFSMIHLPRSTGEVRFGYEVIVRTLPCPSRPRRSSGSPSTRRKWLP